MYNNAGLSQMQCLLALQQQQKSKSTPLLNVAAVVVPRLAMQCAAGQTPTADGSAVSEEDWNARCCGWSMHRIANSCSGQREAGRQIHLLLGDRHKT